MTFRVHARSSSVRPAAVALLLLLVGQTGCVSAKYRLDSKPTPPRALAATAQAGRLEVRVDSIIVYHGAGTWKRDAYWDEYAVTIVNAGAEPVRVESGRLKEVGGLDVESGTNPWQLEKDSKTWWQRVRTSEGGRWAATGGGTVLLGTVAYGASFGAAFTGSEALAVTAAAASVATLAVPVAAVGTVVRNVHARHAIEAEFDRRRLKLPLTVAPGDTAHGSLFFRTAPGALSLVLRTNSEAAPEISIALPVPTRSPQVGVALRKHGPIE